MDISTADSKGHDIDILKLPSVQSQPIVGHAMFQLVDFFYQDRTARIPDNKSKIKLLKHAGFICQEIIAATADFATGYLAHFDARVGDTACQFRAYIVAYLYLHKEKILPQLTEAAEGAQWLLHNVQLVIQELESPSCPNKYFTILTLLERYQLTRTFSKECVFLVLSRFLTVRNTPGDEGVALNIDTDKIRAELNESKSTTTQIINFYQQILSRLSWEYVIDFASQLSLGWQATPQEWQELVRLTDVGRTTMACYYGSFIILKHALSQKINIVFKVTALASHQHVCQFVLMCTPNARCDDYRLIPSLAVEDQQLPAFVMQLSSQVSGHSVEEIRSHFVDQLQCFGISNIFLMNMARHPQYSGKLSTRYRYDPWGGAPVPHAFQTLQKQFLIHRAMADQIGCSKGNPRLFFGRHCYADRLQHALKMHNAVPLKVHPPVLSSHFALFISLQKEPMEHIANHVQLTHWLDRSCDKLFIILGSGLEHAVLDYLPETEAHCYWVYAHTKKQQWLEQHQDYLRSIPASPQLLSMEEYWQHPEVVQYKQQMAQRSQENIEHQHALNHSIIQAQQYWQTIQAELKLSTLEQHHWQDYFYTLMAITKVWQQKNLVPQGWSNAYPILAYDTNLFQLA